MKISFINQDRGHYIDTQIKRSNNKFFYCKVSINHVIKWRNYLYRLLRKNIISKVIFNGPIICLGTRNGREIDLFRVAFFSNIVLVKFVKIFEITKYGWISLLPSIEKLGKSNFKQIKNRSVFGVEINPKGSRKDVLTCSFDQLPEDLENTFSIIYSNSFDQSLDPYKTAKEWIRIAKNDALLIICFSDSEPTEYDPVGNIKLNDLLRLFPGELLFYEKYGSRYHDVIIKLDKNKMLNFK